MKEAFLLGPGHWHERWYRPLRRLSHRTTPLQDRMAIKEWLAVQDVDALLMEEEPSLPGEDDDLTLKFHRLMEAAKPDAIIVYWPAGAKMQTTWDELVILRELALKGPVPPLHYLNHLDAMDLGHGRLKIREAGGRSAYLRGVDKLPAQAWPWTNRAELMSAVEWCGAKVADLPWPREHVESINEPVRAASESVSRRES